MSSAVYPIGMRSKPASGYNHKSTTYNSQYISWKGTGINSNPVGTAPGHIRPLTNNDPGNVFPTGFGLPRPIKHFRKGRVIPVPMPPPSNGEEALINYNMNRFVKSSKGSSLGGGAGGSGMITQMIYTPGGFSLKQNETTDTDTNLIDNECKTCEGTAVVADYYPNKTYLTENPEKNTTNPVFCCNAEYKAKRRAIYASTNLNKNYYTSHKQYLQNRCKTYEQKAFNFLSYKTYDNPEYDSNPYYLSVPGNKAPVPGSPLSFANTYLANCQPNAQIYDATENAMISQMLGIMLNNSILNQDTVDYFYTLKINSIQGFYLWLTQLTSSPYTDPPYNVTSEDANQAMLVFKAYIDNPYWGMPLSGPSNPMGCQLTVYKPNNYQYAKQGAVDSSTRNLKLNVDTISTNAASINNYNNTGPLLVNANQLYAGVNNNVANLLKNKVPGCNTPTVFQFQNKKSCYYNKLPQYQMSASQPSPYRYFIGSVTSTNHFSQSPRKYNTPGR